jgi:hypothetical protein
MSTDTTQGYVAKTAKLIYPEQGDTKMTNKPGAEYLEQCRRHGLSSYAAMALGNVGHRTVASTLGSVGIEANLRTLGLIRTQEEWSGCVTITEHGRRMLTLLQAATRIDEMVSDRFSSRSDWCTALKELTEARRALSEQ